MPDVLVINKQGVCLVVVRGYDDGSRWRFDASNAR